MARHCRLTLLQLFDAEMRCAQIETEVRAEMSDEMEARLREMEEMYSERLLNDVSARAVASPFCSRADVDACRRRSRTSAS